MEEREWWRVRIAGSERRGRWMQSFKRKKEERERERIQDGEGRV